MRLAEYLQQISQNRGNKNSERLAKKRRLAAEDLVAVHLRIGQGLVWIKLTEKGLVFLVDKSEKNINIPGLNEYPIPACNPTFLSISDPIKS